MVLTQKREAEIRKFNRSAKSFYIRDLLAEVARLRQLKERHCSDDDPCLCCRINNETPT